MEKKSLTRSPTVTTQTNHSAPSCQRLQPLGAKIVVVGKGLFGSAAAKYLAQLSDGVMLVGQDEPADWATHTGVFASHYDEARIVSQSAPDDVLQSLDSASIAAYNDIERDSGIQFFTPSGRLTAQPYTETPYYPYLSHTAPACRTATPDEFSYQLADECRVVFEAAPSGYLNPRQMVRAQMACAKRLGATVVSGLVTQVADCGSHVDVMLNDGRAISAEKVLVATGAFANCFELLKRKLAVKAETITTILCEVSAETSPIPNAPATAQLPKN